MQRIPWTGGVNSSVDPGVLPANDLQQADNVVFATSGSRVKREGISYFDTAIPAVIKRSSSGTTRTLQFASSVNIASPADAILVSGEHIKVTLAGNSIYNTTDGTISSITTTTITNDTVSYTFSGATSVTEALTADTTATVVRAKPYLAVHDFWYYSAGNQVKTQELIAVNANGLLFKYDAGGRRTQVPRSGSGATTLAITTLTNCDLRTYNNKLIWSMSGIGNTPKYYDPNTAVEWKDLPGAPDGQYMQEHIGRLWMDDKTTLDRLHFSTTFDETEWLGIGDSGAIDIGIGDGDPIGISAIVPPFKGRLLVGKGRAVYQILGDAPEDFQVAPLAGGQGIESHRACVAVELDDVYFMSQRGVHSVVATDQFGDFSGKFLSKRIQPTYNSWARSRVKFSQGAYLASINSVAWAVSENGQSQHNALWLFNPTIPNEDGELGVWYRWPDVAAQCLCIRKDNSEERLVCGTDESRVLIFQNDTYTDYGTDGIPFRIKTGAIYVDGNPQTIKAFKKLFMFFKPRGRFNFTAYFKVDNAPAQAVAFAQSASGDELGTTFVLGSSVLGSNNILAPFAKDVYGHGRGFTLEIFQTGAAAQVEIYGFAVEYEAADVADETTVET